MRQLPALNVARVGLCQMMTASARRCSGPSAPTSVLVVWTVLGMVGLPPANRNDSVYVPESLIAPEDCHSPAIMLGPVKWPCRSSVTGFGGDAVAAGAMASAITARR